MSGDGPLVSIIVPHYNGKEFILDALESIYAQTYSNIEVVVVDDASPRRQDIEYLQGLSERFGFKLLLHDTNKGVAMTMADAAEASSGEFIAELSQDDLYKPEKIERQLSFLLENGLDAVYAIGDILKEGCADIISRDASKTKSLINSGNALSKLYIQNLPGISLQGLLAKRKVFMEDIIPIWRDYLLDDWPVNVRLFEKYKVGFIDEPLWTGKTHANNTSKNIWKWLGPQIEVPARMAPKDVRLEAIGNRLISMARRLMKLNGDKTQIARLAFAGLMLTDSKSEYKRAHRLLKKVPSRIIRGVRKDKLKLLNEIVDLLREETNRCDMKLVTWDGLGKGINKVVVSSEIDIRLNKLGEIFSSLAYNIVLNDQLEEYAVNVWLAALMLVDDPLHNKYILGILQASSLKCKPLVIERMKRIKPSITYWI